MKKNMNIHYDVYLSLLFIILSLFLYTRTSSMITGAGLFPKILLSSLFVLSIITLYLGIKKSFIITKEQQKEILSFNKIRLSLISLVIVIIYAVLVKYLGFYTSTIIFIFIFMKFCNINKILNILLLAVGIDLFIYFLFEVQLKIFMPKGILF